ncbi:uncharacterized protein LOC125068848 [Vanessa atalanta]|uniref:uncharacterized protein LOC125068848 n=1 Tax=Vanessa atalanta TaxID=42275 RepID=UPI001FCCF2E3|nr:uncharacterized protein LOC125068848 [Vanessa atalanta]
MDDTLGFEESSKKSSTEWQLGVQSDISLAASSNTQPIHQDLYVIPQNEEKSLRPTIDASWIEKLSFYRCYTSTVSKIELLCMQQNSVNRFFWFYIFNVLCKSLPMAYVYIFLSTYAPDHHFFLPKMVPICYGLNVIFVITGIFEIFILLNNTSLYILFIVAGLMNKMPWNRQNSNNIWNADFDLLAESMTAPPIAHIVSARSTNEIRPSRNSAVIITSNAAYYLFRATLAEVIVLFWVYPMGRLIDDITFHYGMFPTKLRVWSFMIVPVFYLIKTYVIISRFNIVRNENDNFRSQHNTRSTFLYQLILFSVFAIYAFYHITIKQKKSWTHLFKPAPEWGPKDFNSRQLRKQFDTREYIGSQAPRPLSRFLISKAELKSYKLDIPYEPVIRRTEVQNENEKL